jgi:hypothetical protein
MLFLAIFSFFALRELIYKFRRVDRTNCCTCYCRSLIRLPQNCENMHSVSKQAKWNNISLFVFSLPLLRSLALKFDNKKTSLAAKKQVESTLNCDPRAFFVRSFFLIECAPAFLVVALKFISPPHNPLSHHQPDH